MWQDVLIMAGGFVLAGALIPALRAKAKPPIVTSLLMAVVLGSYCVAFATLGLWLAAFSLGLQVIIWSILLIYKLRQKER